MIKLSFCPPSAIATLKKCISSGRTYLAKSSILVFVCGAKPNANTPRGRDRLMTYAKKYLKNYHFFMAESFFEVFKSKEQYDLLSLENQLADFCDCIIIVLESESAFAELGAFAIKKELSKIMLVINDDNFQKTQSFIQLGPIAKVDAVSKFRPTLHSDLKSILSIAPDIAERLKTIERKKNKKLDIGTFDNFSGLLPKDKMLFLLDLISLFHPIRYRELIYLLKEFYGEHNFNINIEMGLLKALGLIFQYDDYYVRDARDHERFIELKTVQEISLRASIINHYHKYSRERAAILRKKIEFTK